MPSIDPQSYQHPLDQSALRALKAIPGFTPLLKLYLKTFTERAFYVENNSSHIELSPRQIPEVYDLLPPICDKLGIPVPHLFLKNERSINAYTSNESDPFIVIHSGTLECCSPEVVAAIIGHECGHIASHHVLYHQMGDMILSGAMASIPLFGKFINTALKGAFLEWMRASELTADRAAALATGNFDYVVDMCVTLAGAYGKLELEINKQAFIDQALEYEQAVNQSFLKKYYEVTNYTLMEDHPRNAYRALEIVRWAQGGPQYQYCLDVIAGRVAAQIGPYNAQPLIDPAAGPAPAPVQPSLPAQPVSPQQGAAEQPVNIVIEENVTQVNEIVVVEEAAQQAQAETPADKPVVSVNFCGSCGTKVNEGSLFCESCGAKLPTN